MRPRVAHRRGVPLARLPRCRHSSHGLPNSQVIAAATRRAASPPRAPRRRREEVYDYEAAYAAPIKAAATALLQTDRLALARAGLERAAQALGEALGPRG